MIAVWLTNWVIAMGSQMPVVVGSSNLSYRLHVASTIASARHDCTSPRQKRYTADFDRVYGARIRALKAVHEAKAGPDPEFVVTTDCRVSGLPPAQQDAGHRRAMRDFEPRLRALEREFGGERGDGVP